MALIEIRKLTKLYRMGDSTVRALDGVDLSIESGEFVAITGASGSGKSTMMHLLGCLDRPTAGSYVLNGRDVSAMSDSELAIIRNREIGFVFQTFNLINRTSAVENVGVPLFYARKMNTSGPSKKALERVGLGHRGGHKPNELSGGERQRVAIARAIVNEPVLMLADEPTGNLDSRTGEQIMEIFHNLNRQGVTIIIGTHEPEVARQARRVVQMRDGKIVGDGPPSNNNVQTIAIRSAAASPSPVTTPIATAPTSAVLAPSAAPTPLPVTSQTSTAPSVASVEEFVPVLHATMSPGATVGVWLGGIALACGIASLITAKVIATKLGNDFKYDSNRPPPTPIIVAGLALIVGYLGAVVIGLIAILRSYFAIRAIKSATAPQLGKGRAWTGLAMGTVAAMIPFLPLIVASFTRGV